MGDIDKNSRRSKPQQEIYRPGSGPLRKSDRQAEENDAGRSNNSYRNPGSYSRAPNRSNEISEIADTLKKITLGNQDGTRKLENEPTREGRRARKPDNAIYVPRPVVEAAREEQTRQSANTSENPSANSNPHKKSNRKNEPRRKRIKKPGGKDTEGAGEDRDMRAEETLKERVDNVDKHKPRYEDTRQDRNAGRLVEDKFENTVKSVKSDKREQKEQYDHYDDHKERYNPAEEQRHSNKPPFYQGGRGGRGGMTLSKFDSLPPRFKKLYMVENGHKFVNPSDENWDATTVTIHRHDPPAREYNTVVSRGRGRARARPEQHTDLSHPPRPVPERFARSLTPERLKESLTPLRRDNRAASSEILSVNHKSKDNLKGNDERSYKGETREWRLNERPPRSERNTRNEARSHRNDESVKDRQSWNKNEDRQPWNKNEDRQSWNKNEDRQSWNKNEDRQSWNKNEDRQSRNKNEDRQSRSKNEDRQSFNKKNEDKHYWNKTEDRPIRNNDKVSQNATPTSRNEEISPKEEMEAPTSDGTPANEDILPRRSSGKLYNPESDKLEEVTTEVVASKPFDIVLDWAAEVEMCEELDSLDDEPYVFAKPAAPPPLMKQQPFLHHQPPPLLHQTHHQPPRSRRNRRRSGSRGRNSRRNSVDFGSNNPSRNNSQDRSGLWMDNNWRFRRDEDSHSRQSSVDRGDAWANSIDRRKGRSRRSSERSTGGGGGGGGGGGRRRRSSERSGGGGRRRRSSERSGSGRAPENTNWRLEPRCFEEHPRNSISEQPKHEPHNRSDHHKEQPKSSRSSDSSKTPESKGESSKPQGILVLPPSHDTLTSPVQVPAHHSPPQRQLYNPANPDKPIMVSPSRISAHEENSYTYQFTAYPPHFANNMGEQISAGRSLLYTNYLEMPKAAYPRLVKSMELADSELQYYVSTAVFEEWDRIRSIRTFLKDSLKDLLLKELKFCETENVEQHFWRILYYNIIELLRKLMVEKPEKKDRCRDLLIDIIDEGKEYYEGLVSSLENTFKVKFDRVNPMVQELSGFPALSLISAQKMFLYLGDLARYREQAFETSNYGQARQWYLKANQMHPKNGRPYNQLAILAFYTGRKIDAVYYYMRTLIASSPLASARESLVHIFDENRKKYEAEEKKKKEEKEARERERMREKEGSCGGLRREVWVHPGGKKNLHRTSTSSSTAHSYHSDIDTLSSIPPSELNKRFSMCYLHVIGKIFTKIGLESLNETATQMLKEFRALLQHSPVQVKPTRFIQIMALNMFILEITQPKNEEVDTCYRSTLQESALVISLEMFNIILERFVSLVGQDQPKDVSALPPDCLQLLPPIKVWCDWLITHIEVWNPPPSPQDLSVGAGNCWEKLASLVNILERMTQSCDSVLEDTQKEGYEFILLPENATLAGYTPLMANSEEPVFMRPDTNMDIAQNCLRVHRLLFFGTVFLCGLDPPLLKLHKMETGDFHYISIVDTVNSQEICEGEVFIESESESGVSEESEDSGKASGTEEEPTVPTQLKQLIETRQRLETLARKQMYKQSRKQRIIKEQEIVVEMEIRPKYLLPDTNCFIDYLELLSSIVKSHPHHPYIIMVPLVVVNELEGLSKVCKPGPSVTHAAHVKEAARAALHLLQERQPALKPVTTRGHILNSTAFIFEEDTGPDMKNDDKILATCLNLCRMSSKDDITEGGKRKLYRDVVLLTEDRNLRLKALSRDVPVRELQDFVAWAGLG